AIVSSIPTDLDPTLWTSTQIYSLSFHSSRAHRDLHSFPTRRSSDLKAKAKPLVESFRERRPLHDLALPGRRARRVLLPAVRPSRSEEHTSELQSRVDLVCRLLLEKKKKKKHTNIIYTRNYSQYTASI